MPNIKLSPAQTVILHTILSIVLSALVAGYTAAIDQVHGQFNIPLALTIFFSAAGVSLVARLATLRNNPQFDQAVLDTLKQFADSHTQLIPLLMQLFAQLPSPTQQHPPVVVNLAQPKAEQPVTIGTENVSSAPQSSQQPPQSQHAVSHQPTGALGQPQVMMSGTPSQPQQVPFPDPGQSRHWGDTGVVPVAALSQQQSPQH